MSNRSKVYVVGGGFQYIQLMFTLGCDGAKGLNDADIVLFTGGEDVNPELYGEPCMAKTHFNRQRDDKEKAIFEAARDIGLPMVGICRGGQFLNVMNGGKLWQHVSNHCGNHVARVEVAPMTKDGKRRTIEVTSTHHQMMIPTDEAVILCTANIAFEKNSPAYTRMGRNEDNPDIEVVFYDDTSSLCFQPHPEFSNAPASCVDFFEECMDNFIIPRVLTKEQRKTAEAVLKKAEGKPAKKKTTLTVPKTKEKAK